MLRIGPTIKPSEIQNSLMFLLLLYAVKRMKIYFISLLWYKNEQNARQAIMADVTY